MKQIIKNINNMTARFVYIQLLTIVLITLGTLMMTTISIAQSFFLGGMSCVIPNWFFAKRFCRTTGAQNARNIVFDIYTAEFLKLLLTGLIFWLIFTFIPVTITPIFIGFISAQAMFWVSVLILKNGKYGN